VSGNIFSDDFEDNDVSDRHFSKGNWSASGGNLIGTAPRNATAFPNAFTGCAKCTIETDMQLDSAGGKVSLLAWYADSSNYVEVTFSDAKDKVIFKQHVAGAVKTKKLIPFPIQPGVNHHLKVSYDGFVFRIFLDGNTNPLATLCPKSDPSGVAGFRLSGSATFQQINIY